MDELRRNPKCKDFICVLYGFGYTGREMELYTRNRLKTLHQNIYRQLAGLPCCQQNCSATYKLAFNRWCETCSKWRKELMKERRRGRTDWEKTESWKWPDSYENILDVFLPSDWARHNSPQFSDISTQCHVWNACKTFNLNPTFVQNVRVSRNATFHNSSFETTDVEKSKAFDALKDLIKDPDTAADIDVNGSLNKLREIETDNYDHSHINESLLLMAKTIAEDNQSNVEQRLNDICYHLTDIRDEYRILGRTYEGITREFETLKRTVIKHKRVAIILILVLLFILLTIGTKIPFPDPFGGADVTNKEENSIDIDECFSESYSYPFVQDLPLLDYVRDNKRFIGRKWLFKLFQEKLLQTETSSHGIVSVAEFGYGKSAVVSHLLCARPGENGHFLRNHLTAFHICKYDVASTQLPERFIKRLVGFFATKIPEYGNIITLLSNATVLYDSEKCGKELDACFDQAFRIPFKKIKTEHSTKIVVIDALDECFHLSKNRNFILDLLSTRIRYFPKWVKFLITSRDMVQLDSLRKLDKINLLANASNNLNDIKEYFEAIYKESFHTVDSKSRALVHQLLETSEGNFLYVIHALQYVQSPDFNGDLPKLPLSLEDIYELNFDRQFQDGKTFNVARVILEVVCASLTPLNKIDIYKVLKNSGAIDMTFIEFEREFEKLSFFVKAEDGVILRHKAMHSWLVASSTDRYKVSPIEGHVLISKHLLKAAEQNGTGDILVLVIHLSKSKDQSLRKVFRSFDIKKAMSFEEQNVLHNLISMTKSEDALELLLDHHLDVNIIDENGVSPAFHAAAKGHLSQLKLLLRKGADINFAVDPCRRCDTQFHSIENDIEEIKTTYYSGYGLLHIAVQHKYTDVTKYLIQETGISLNHENVLGKRPSDIACENGHFEIVKMFVSRNLNLIDDKCLYFATRNGHFKIVKCILETGFRPNCIGNKTAMKELGRIKQSCQCETKSNFVSNSIRPLDTWWIVLQETPLHNAIRAGHSKIVKYITEKAKHLNRCVDAYGYTPFLLGIKYGRYELTHMSRERASKDKCSPAASFLKQDNVKGYGTVINRKGESICPEGATFAHLIAMYDRTKILDIFEGNETMKWNSTDKFGNRPIHYAASHGSTSFIRFMSSKFGKNFFEERSKNGSTAYHVAAISCSELSLKTLTNDLREDITDLTDTDNRTLLFYALMCERGRFMVQNSLNFRSQKYLFSLTNISHVDNYGRNILHYVLRFGHEEMLHYLQEQFPFHYKRMLITEDIHGLTPIKYTIYFAPNVDSISSFDISKLLNNDSVNTKTERMKHVLYPWEICLIDIQKSILQDDVRKLFMADFDRIVIKSPFLTKALSLNLIHSNLADSDASSLRQLIVNGIRMAKFFQVERILIQSLQAISYTMPYILHDCGKSLYRSPLHYIALTFPLTWGNDTVLLDVLVNVFKKLKKKSVKHCSTTNGLNLLHHSIIGGNINFTNYFKLETNIPVVNENVSATDILYMTVFARYKDNAAHNKRDLYSSLDVFLSKFIKDRKSELKASDFCSMSSKNLSLVHMFAINGMDRTLKTVANLYGFENTHCKNIHNFTPLYFSNLFGRQTVTEFLGKSGEFINPDINATEFLFLNIINNFPQMSKQNPFRCITSRRMGTMHTRTLIQNFQCLKRFYEVPSFVTLNEYFIHNIVYAREGLYLAGKCVLNYLKIYRFYMDTLKDKTILNCSGFAEMVIEMKETLTSLSTWAENRNKFLSWTCEYPFLKNILLALNLPFASKLTPFRLHKVDTNCAVKNVRYIWHIVMYLERTLRAVIQNLQDTTVLIALMDQKSFWRIQNLPIRFNGLEPNIHQYLPEFGFSLCYECPFHFKPNIVYNVNRYRYLNIIKSTITYKHIDTVSPIMGNFFLSDKERIQLDKKFVFINKMLRSAKRRQKWIPVHMKCDNNLKCTCNC